MVSENPDVYRAEYLAWRILQAAHHPAPADAAAGRPAVLSVPELAHLSDAELLAYVQQFMAPRYQEGYLKGVHDHDAARLLTALVRLTRTADLLRYPADTRAAAALFWLRFCDPARRAHWQQQLQGIGVLLQIFPDSQQFDQLQTELQTAVDAFALETGLFTLEQVQEAGEFLFYALLKNGSLTDLELPQNDLSTTNEALGTNNPFPISQEAADLYQQFQQQLQERRATELFEQSVERLAGQPVAQFQLVQQWVQASHLTPRPPLLGERGSQSSADGLVLTSIDTASTTQQEAKASDDTNRQAPPLPEERGLGGEVAVLLLTHSFDPARVIHTPTRETLTNFQGTHPRLSDARTYALDFPAFRRRLRRFEALTVPRFEQFQAMKKQRLAEATEALRLESFRPRVLTSFVRNQLIDQVYLPLIGANLAKQIEKNDSRQAPPLPERGAGG